MTPLNFDRKISLLEKIFIKCLNSIMNSIIEKMRNKMNPLDLFNQVKELIETKDFEAAKTFVAENQEQLGEYFSQAQQLISGSEGLDGLVGKIKGFL